MSIKPIDLQVNISHMHEVAKNEQSKSSAIAETQHVLVKESNEKSREVQSKLNENKKAERTIILREEKGRQKGGLLKNKEKKKKRDEKTIPADNVGMFIDIKK